MLQPKKKINSATLKIIVLVSFVVLSLLTGIVLSLLTRFNELESIEIVRLPNKINYVEEELFNDDGLQVKAKYKSGAERIVEDYIIDKTEQLTIIDNVITISYTENEVTITTSFQIAVVNKDLESLSAISQPQKTVFYVGEYWDFLGLSVQANYSNAPGKIVNNWDWDKKLPLTLDDDGGEIIINYSYAGKTKTLNLSPISVIESDEIDEELQQIQSVFAMTFEITEITEENYQSAKYLIELYNNLSLGQKEQLENKQDYEDLIVLLANYEEELSHLPPPPEPTYNVYYAIFNGYNFTDINYNSNSTTYQNSLGAISLLNPTSTIAIQEGYEFKYWTDGFGNTITQIENLESDMTYYAVFELTENVLLKFYDYENKTTLLLEKTITRKINDNYIYNFKSNNIADEILSETNFLAVAFLIGDISTLIRSENISTQSGAELFVYVKTTNYQIVNIEPASDINISWQFEFEDDNEEAVNILSGSFNLTIVNVPISAILSITSAGLSIDKILANGEIVGARSGFIPASASFEIVSDEDPLDISFERLPVSTTTITFNGITTKSYQYGSGWDGKLSTNDLYDISVVFGEDSTQYLNTYLIDTSELLFTELSDYTFTVDTAVIVERKLNNFTITINFIEDSVIVLLTGKQTLQDALNGKTGENINILNHILENEQIFTDSGMLTSITAQDILETFVTNDLIYYSNFEGFPPPTINDLYGEADYTGQNFIGVWTALFNKNNEIYSISLTLTTDGTFSYTSQINSLVSAQISGIYRLENYVIIIKEITLQGDYPTLVSISDFNFNPALIEDDLCSVAFLNIQGTQVTKFNTALTKGSVKPINYIGQEFVKTYTQTVINENISQILTITLNANGTAIIHGIIKENEVTIFDVTNSGFYRYIDGNILLNCNGILDTNDITNLLLRMEVV